MQYPSLLAVNDVDVNPVILSLYINEIVPAICKSGDDEQHGSSTLCDIAALQALSKRIHLGKFVAETKFQVGVDVIWEVIATVVLDDIGGIGSDNGFCDGIP